MCITVQNNLDGAQKFEGVCPAGCHTTGEHNVWGTYIYTDDSRICRSAIHAGAITNEGGNVEMEMLPGQSSYLSSENNGILSKSYGAFRGSCSPTSKYSLCPESKEIDDCGSPFTKNYDTCSCDCNVECPASNEYLDPETCTCKAYCDGLTCGTNGALDIDRCICTISFSCSDQCYTVQNSLDGAEKFEGICPAGCYNTGSVWGTDVYTDDSRICRLAIHAGAITNEGGKVVIEMSPGLSSYLSSENNGVSTTSYGSWRGSCSPTSKYSLCGESKEIDDCGSPFTKNYDTCSCDCNVECPASNEYLDPETCTCKAYCDGLTCGTNGALDIDRCICTISFSCSDQCYTVQNSLDGAAKFEGICPAGCYNTGSVWGTDVYTDDSRICRLAIHAGAITNEGGKVEIEMSPGLSSYLSSENNGVQQTHTAVG